MSRYRGRLGLLLGTRATVLSIAAGAAGLFPLGSTITLLTHRGG